MLLLEKPDEYVSRVKFVFVHVSVASAKISTKPESTVEAGIRSYILLITTYDADFEFTAGSCLLNVTTYYSIARDSYGYVDVAIRLIMYTTCM